MSAPKIHFVTINTVNWILAPTLIIYKLYIGVNAKQRDLHVNVFLNLFYLYMLATIFFVFIFILL